MTDTAAGRAPILVYDGDCGFCSTSARFARRWVDGRERYAIEPYQRLNPAAWGLTAQQCSTSSWFVTADGRRFGGAASIAAALRHSAIGWRPLGVLLAAPLVRNLAAIGYRSVSANRFRLPGGTPACRVDDSQRR
ncbi:thiol-disulfide oxidoreductase DCC family protein [Nakamurella lactea]|uniref:thiol-disulfide oxidoreductase DCC family protein n=1 Tax=Nakamurella lactea TaxID=459515 RepID=UPI000406130E|nr:DCC1-like thiol-disulfide oxidoreductase family protein [Nakamurella lactea]